MKNFVDLQRTAIRSLYWMALLASVFILPLHGVYNNVYSTTTNGAMSWTGNTLGIEGSADGIMSEFILAPNSAVPPTTTLNWEENNSFAILDIPAGSTILHAELIWGGNTLVLTENDLIAIDVLFTTPDGLPHTISPDPLNFQMDRGRYVISADVTSLVTGGGAYGAGHIYGTLGTTISAAGWTLAVAYGNPNCYTNNMNIYVAAQRETEPPELVTGFATPVTGDVTTRLFCSAIEGDAARGGDSYLIGDTNPINPTNKLSGTNNPPDNFFAAQINTLLPVTTNGEGKFVTTGSSQLDTRGSFGNNNSDAINGIDIAGARHSWDITSVDATAYMNHGQTFLYVQNTTSLPIGERDQLTVCALGLQIRSSAPALAGTKNVVPTQSFVGGVLDFTVTFTNNGDLPAENAVFTDVLQPGLSLYTNSVFVNGSNIPSPDLAAGIPLGTIGIGETVTITFSALITANAPSYINSAMMDYTFIPFGGSPTVAGSAATNEVAITLDAIPPPPPVANPDAAFTSEGVSVSGNVLSNDTGYYITVTSFDAVSAEGGTVTITPDGNYTYTPLPGFAGVDTFTYTITDTLERTASTLVTITVISTPLNFVGTIESCKFVNRSDYTLRMSWTATADPTAIEYRIYLAGDLVATVPIPGPLTYSVLLPSRAAAEQYQLTYVNASNFESQPVPIVIIDF